MNNILLTSVLSIMLIIFKFNLSCATDPKQLDDQCSTYCHKVMKPLLQYVNKSNLMTQDHSEKQHRIQMQEQTINNLNELIKLKEMQLAQQIKLSETFESQSRYQHKLIDQCDMQAELKSKLNYALQSHNRNQQKLIDLYEMQLSNVKLEITFKDTEIKSLQSANAKVEALQNQITAYKQTSSCLGKLTEIHAIRVPIVQTMTVPCESNLPEAGAGWIVILRREDGSVNFNRTWAEYKEGFGDLRGEFFLGLEKLHLLTQSQPHELFVFLEDFANQTRYARYSHFVVGNETEFYELKELGTYSGNAGDSMEYHKNKKFSTTDFNSHVHETCAKAFSSGWWFGSCYLSNLNGRYAYFDSDKDIKSINWYHWKYKPMKFAQMMIRPSLS